VTPEAYDAWYDTPRGRWIGDAEFQLLCSHLETHPGTSLLDVGCGTGWFTRRFAAAGLEVTGIDVDRAALDFARRRSGSAVRFVQGDARSLPFADQSFDQVVSITALCFVDDWARAVAEIVRVCRHRFVLGLLNRQSLLWLEKGRGGGKGGYRGAYWHTRTELAVVLKALPVENVHFSTAIFLPSGSRLARAVESAIPKRLPWGAFLVLAGDIKPGRSEAGLSTLMAT
jgi:SAM-dependent methyltransferase